MDSIVKRPRLTYISPLNHFGKEKIGITNSGTRFLFRRRNLLFRVEVNGNPELEYSRLFPVMTPDAGLVRPGGQSYNDGRTDGVSQPDYAVGYPGDTVKTLDTYFQITKIA